MRFNSDSRIYSGDYADMLAVDTEANGPALDGMEQSANINLGAYSAVILSQ